LWGVIPRTVLRIWETEIIYQGADNPADLGNRNYQGADSPADMGKGNYQGADSPADMGNGKYQGADSPADMETIIKARTVLRIWETEIIHGQTGGASGGQSKV
jgi:hypothetical protein